MSKLENLTERELLIETITNVENLCKKFESFKEDNKGEHATLFTLLGDQATNKVSNRLFFFSIALIITALLSLTAYTGIIKNDVVKNTVCIEKLEAPEK